jgi:hypothetical protein
MMERASTLEQISSAMVDESSRDWVAALGMAQVARGDIRPHEAKLLEGVVDRGLGSQALITALGAHLTRLQTVANQLTYDKACESIAAVVRRLNAVRRWALDDRQIRRVAESALLLHLHPTCTSCHGRQYEAIPQTPHLSKIECPACRGTGLRPMPRRNAEEVAYVLNVLGLIQGLTERAVARKHG